MIGRTEWGRGLKEKAASGLVQIVKGGTSTPGGRESSQVAAGLNTAGAAAPRLREPGTSFVPSKALEGPKS